MIQIKRINHDNLDTWRCIGGAGNYRKVLSISEDEGNYLNLKKGLHFLLNGTIYPDLEYACMEVVDRFGKIWKLFRDLNNFQVTCDNHVSDLDRFLVAESQSTKISKLSVSEYSEEKSGIFVESKSTAPKLDKTASKIKEQIQSLISKCGITINDNLLQDSDILDLYLQLEKLNNSKKLIQNTSLDMIKKMDQLKSKEIDQRKICVIEKLQVSLVQLKKHKSNNLQDQIIELEKHLVNALKIFGLKKFENLAIDWDTIIKDLSKIYAWTEILSQSRLAEKHHIKSLRPYFIKANANFLKIENRLLSNDSDATKNTIPDQESLEDQFLMSGNWFEKFKETQKSSENNSKTTHNTNEVSNHLTEIKSALEMLGKNIENLGSFSKNAVSYLNDLKTNFKSADHQIQLPENVSISQVIKLIQLYGQIPIIQKKLQEFKDELRESQEVEIKTKNLIEEWRLINENISTIPISSKAIAFSESTKILSYKSELDKKIVEYKAIENEVEGLKKLRNILNKQSQSLEKEIDRKIDQLHLRLEADNLKNEPKRALELFKIRLMQSTIPTEKKVETKILVKPRQDSILTIWNLNNGINQDLNSEEISDSFLGDIVIAKTKTVQQSLLEENFGRLHFTSTSVGNDNWERVEPSNEFNSVRQTLSNEKETLKKEEPKKQKPIELELQDKVAKTLAILNGRH